MKFYSILLVLVLTSFARLYSQEYQGIVVDKENGSPVPYASIWIVDLNTGVSCNSQGRFLLDFSLPQTMHIKVSAVGYTSAISSISKNDTNQIVLVLSPSHIELQEMEISTTTGILQNYSITNVESKTLEELTTINTTTLGQSLGNISGVYNNSTGNGINKPVIRGMSGMRVSTYLNGLKIENQQWGGDHGIGVDALGIEKVEVIKGASSLLYGSDALGGVIYLHEEEYAESNMFEAGINSQFEVNSMGITNGFHMKIAKKNIRFNLFGNQTSQADYQVPNGDFVFNSRFKGQGIKAALGMNKNNWVGNIRYTFVSNELGIPGHTHDSVPSKEDLFKPTSSRKKTLPLQVNSSHFLSTDHKLYFNKSELKFTLGLVSNNLEEFDEKVTIPGIAMKLNTFSFNGLWSITSWKKHKILIGAQGNIQTNKNNKKAEEILLQDLRSNSTGVFGMIHSKWNQQLETQFGIRADRNEFEIASNSLQDPGLTLNYQSLTYSAGLSYKKNKHAYRINISSGYRPPHPIESLANGVHHSSRRFEIGSLSLQPEFANQLDLSYEFNNEHIGLLLNPYVSVIQHYVYLNYTDSLIDNYPVVNYAQNELTYFYGGEVTLHYHPHFLHNLHIETHYTYLFAEDAQGKAISQIPQPRLMGLLTYDIESKSNLIPSSLALQATLFGSQQRVIENEIYSDQYNLLDLGASWKIASTKLKGHLKIGARNITNTNYINHLSELKPLGIQNPGRNFYISLNLKINQKTT